MELDHESKICYLSLVIKSICEENNICKHSVIKDFINLLNPDKKELDEEELYIEDIEERLNSFLGWEE